MAKQVRIDAAEAYEKAKRGEALLVCAYRDEEKCRRLRFEGALTFGEFRDKLDELPREREIIFYCT